MPVLPLLWRFADRFVPSEVRADADETERLRRTRLLVLSIFGMFPLAILGGWRMITFGEVAVPAWAALLPLPVLLGCLVLLRFGSRSRFAGALFCVVIAAFVAMYSIADHGLRSPAMMWLIPVPLFAAFVVGWRAAITSAAILIAGTVALYFAQSDGFYNAPALSSASYLLQGSLIGIVSALFAVTAIAWLYEGYTVERLRAMNTELRTLRTDLQKSEEEYRSLFENIPTGAYRSTPEGRIVMANRALLKMLGVENLRALDDIDAASLYANPEDRRRLLHRLDEVDELHGADYVLRSRDGREVTVRESAHAVRDDHGEVQYYEGIIEDVSAARTAEEATRRVEERHRALVQHSTDIITLIDVAGRIEYQSPSVSRCLGYDHNETVGVHVTELVHPDDRGAVRVMLRKALSSADATGTFRFRCRHKDGHYVYLESVGSNMLDNPAVRGFVVNSRDVTDQKRAEVALIRSKEQAEEVARLKSAFLANMSHEIRTPLTGIIGFAGVLSEELTDEHREFVELIELSGRRLLQTLNSVLDLARLEADQMEVDLCQLDVCAHVDEAVQLLQPLAADKGIALTVEAPASPAYSRLDTGCLNRILNNLVGNALKFTDEGEVRVVVVREGDNVRIDVTDTGIGIDDTFLPHLFDEFKQESTGLQRQHEGSGLGLTITRRLVELMRGTISVTSEKGVGSTFSITFPLFSGASATVDRLTGGSHQPRVLVVDDNDSTLALMRHIIAHVASVDVAPDQASALGLVEKNVADPYDLIFMDIHLGGATTGAEVMHQIRRYRGYEKARIIAFTAFALPGDRERFINEGFSGYLGKPFTRHEVLEIIDEVVAEVAANNRQRDQATALLPAGDGQHAFPADATFISG